VTAPAASDDPRTRLRRAWRRISHAVRPLVTVVDPPAGIIVDRDVEVAVRDGTVLRVDVFRPAVDPSAAGGTGIGDGHRWPVLLCAHPYAKATTPKRRRGGRWSIPFQFRALTQSEPFTISAWTSWEAPDPGFWVPRGYVVVNLDLRGWGTSDGVGELLSAQEGRDIADVIEWAGGQPWSTGRVGMTGVSYLAITQWAAASERPAHLVAINPWEGFTDLYRDLGRPGGIREDGFLRLWTTMARRERRSPVELRDEVAARPLEDDWWRARNRAIEQIEVPALVCASFSDHCLHSRGSFDGHRRIASARRYLFAHRGPKWATFYARAGREAQVEFFDHLLLDRATGLDDRPPVRVEIRSDGSTVAGVRRTTAWPPPDVSWTTLHLDSPTPGSSDGRGAGVLGADVPGRAGASSFRGRDAARFVHRFTETTDVVGPMWAALHVEVLDGPDAHVFVGVDLVRDGRRVGFEGSYGFGDDLVTHGMLRVALRRTVDPDGRVAEPPPWIPDHPYDRYDAVTPGSIVPLAVELHASATRFSPGDELHLLVQGRWFFATNPLTGQFPARYVDTPDATVRLHTGPDHDSTLHLPIWPS